MQQAVNISPLVHSDTGALRLSPYICYQQVSVLHCLTKYSCWELPLCTERHIASFPCCLLLCFLDSICDLWITQRSGRRLRISPTSSNCKVWIRLWCNVDSVSVIMATCPHTRMATDSKRHKTTQVLSRFHIILCRDQVHLRFEYTGGVPDLLPLLWAVQRSCMWSRQQSGRRPGNEAKLQCHNTLYIGLNYSMHCWSLLMWYISSFG